MELVGEVSGLGILSRPTKPQGQADGRAWGLG